MEDYTSKDYSYEEELWTYSNEISLEENLSQPLSIINKIHGSNEDYREDTKNEELMKVFENWNN